MENCCSFVQLHHNLFNLQFHSLYQDLKQQFSILYIMYYKLLDILDYIRYILKILDIYITIHSSLKMTVIR